jgi:hypothetical protein
MTIDLIIIAAITIFFWGYFFWANKTGKEESRTVLKMAVAITIFLVLIIGPSFLL